MIPGEALLDAFINANILLCVGYLLWSLVRLVLSGLGLKHAYGTQLKLLNTVFVAIVLAPFVAIAFQELQSYGVAREVKVNLSDMVVSYYLNGGLEMKASEFEKLILMRDTFILDVLNGTGPMARTAVVIFLGGLAIGLFRLGYSILCLLRIVGRSYAWRSIGRVRIRLSDNTLVPFSARGWRNYYVVIPSHMLAQSDELRVSMAHEFQHIRQGDLEWEMVLELLKPFFFLNPMYHAWKRQVEHLRELSCDSAVLSLGRIDVRTYCETLLSVCQKTLRRDRDFVIAVPKVTLVTADRSVFADGKPSFLEHRIVSLLNARPFVSRKLLFVLTVVPLIAMLAIATVAIQRPGDWSQDRLMLSTVVNLDRLDEINRLSTFGRARN